MGAVLSFLAVIALSLRLVYVRRFAYRSRLDQPLKYAQVKRALNRATAVLVLLAAALLVAEDSTLWAAILVLGSLVATYVVQGGAYSRAVWELSNSRNPETGEYIFKGTAKERDEIAATMVKMDRA